MESGRAESGGVRGGLGDLGAESGLGLAGDSGTALVESAFGLTAGTGAVARGGAGRGRRSTFMESDRGLGSRVSDEKASPTDPTRRPMSTSTCPVEAGFAAGRTR